MGKRFTKKQILYSHIIEARRKRAMYNRLQERYEDKGEEERAERAFINVCEWSNKESAFIASVTIVYGEYGCQLEQNLIEFEEKYYAN